MIAVPCGGMPGIAGPCGPHPYTGLNAKEVPVARKTDTNAILSELHAGLAIHLKEKLDDGTISSSELSVLERFLKANGISAQPVEGSPFSDLVSSLPDLDKVVHMKSRRAA